MKTNKYLKEVLRILSINPNTFHSIGGAMNGRVNNWNNIPGYNSQTDLSKNLKSITENELHSVLEYAVKREYIERGNSGLIVRLANKGLEFYEQENKSWYTKIWEKYGKEIIVGVIVAVIAGIILYRIGVSN